MQRATKKTGKDGKPRVFARIPRKILAFHLVAARGERKLIEWFVHSENLPVDSRDSNWNTALMYASEKGNENGVGKLLMLGACPNTANRDGRTALMLAAANGHRNSVRMMLGYRAKAYLQDKNGKKSADYARENGHPETARMLEMHQHILNRAAGAAVNAGKKGEAKYYLCEGADPAALEKTGAQFLNITSD